MSMDGCVYLVGAGCGEADLITVRGRNLLKDCDAVVYDDLIAEALLSIAPPGAERVYMGKRGGRHSAPQADISQALVDLARQGKAVVRLKGGDPFVFGRGGEEIQALQAAGVPYEEVPGISSCIAIPAAAGIPVTHRGLSRGFHVATAHTADTPDGLPADFDQLARVQGTLVFLMGLGQLPLIVRQLLENGRAPSTPAAVISGGNAPAPQTVRGTLADICQGGAAVRPPAVIVVGDTAALDFSATRPVPLRGVRVGLTGTAAITEKLAPRLRAQGAEVSHVQRAAVVPLPLSPDLDGLWDREPGWIVFTSSNGVRVFFAHLKAHRTDLRTLSAFKFAVIGRATGETLAGYGFYPDLCPARFTSRDLAEALIAAVPRSQPVCLFRSAQGSPVLRELLEGAGYSLADIPAYQVDPEEPAESGPLDYLVFASAGGVRSWFDSGRTVGADTLCVCIGYVTAEALRRRGVDSFLTAGDISAEGLFQVILADRMAKGAE